MYFYLLIFYLIFTSKPNRWQEKKENSFKYVVIHSIVYGLTTFILTKLICINFENIYLWIIIFSHFLIDAIKFFLKKNKFIKKHQKYVFIIDQILHATILIIVSYFVIKSGKNFRYNPVVLDILNVIGISIQSSIILIVHYVIFHTNQTILFGWIDFDC